MSLGIDKLFTLALRAAVDDTTGRSSFLYYNLIIIVEQWRMHGVERFDTLISILFGLYKVADFREVLSKTYTQISVTFMYHSRSAVLLYVCKSCKIKSFGIAKLITIEASAENRGSHERGHEFAAIPPHLPLICFSSTRSLQASSSRLAAVSAVAYPRQPQ